MARDSGDGDKLIDTLQLSEERWAELSAKLEEVDIYAAGQRRYERISYRKLSQIAVAIQRPDGKWAKYIVRSRDLSPGGIGFIHGTFVHPGSACRVILKDTHNNIVCLEGTVRRCELITGHAHDIGVQFNQEIDLIQFLGESDTPSDSQRDAG